MKKNTFNKRRNPVRLLLLLFPLCGLWFMGQGPYIHAKASLAQILLETAWTKTIDGQKEVKPWPWADTWPVSRLSVPRLGIHRIVLAGASRSALAFGPGHLFKSAAPGEFGNTIIKGHPDTHFQFLKDLKPGDSIQLQSESGNIFVYKVLQTIITDEADDRVMEGESGPMLTLVSSYPFDAIQIDGAQLYVVIAKRMARFQQV